MHYTPPGVPTVDQTALGVVEAPEPPRFVAQSRLIRNHDLLIPPGAPAASFEVDHVFREPVLLRSLTPHMHLRGRSMLVELFRPDEAGPERMIEIPEWDSDWQFSYVFRDKPMLPAGSRLHVVGVFDNSAANLDNPDPEQTVRDGPQIWDEMLILAVEWIRPRAEL